jgi:hypothetical protein
LLFPKQVEHALAGEEERKDKNINKLKSNIQGK